MDAFSSRTIHGYIVVLFARHRVMYAISLSFIYLLCFLFLSVTHIHFSLPPNLCVSVQSLTRIRMNVCECVVDADVHKNHADEEAAARITMAGSLKLMKCVSYWFVLSAKNSVWQTRHCS